MPSFDLRGIKVAKYVNNSGTISYTGAVSVGDAMSVAMSLRYAEGRLYAESSLAEYIRKATGGSISIAVKYIPDEAQKLMFGAIEKTRSVSSKQVKSLQFNATSAMSYVGVAFYAPDMVDGVEKYTCVKVARCLFGTPDMSYATSGETITFNTPTTSGEFMRDNSAAGNLFEVAVCDTEADALAWITEVLK